MSDAKPQHTPGPWIISASSHGIEWSHWIDSGTPTSKRLVAAVAIDNLRDGPEEANAHLIAAAPELLEAIKKFIAFGKNGGDTSWHSAAAQSFFYDMMLAAGKSEGRS